MLKLLGIIFFICSQALVQAEVYYCWAISGLNIRETPSPDGKILGKIDYGRKFEIELANQEYGNYYEEISCQVSRRIRVLI